MGDRIAFRIGENDFTKEELDEKADSLGITRTDLIKKAVKSIMELDSDLIKTIDQVSENVNLTFAEVIQGFVTKRIAEIDAYKEIWETSRPLLELMRTAEGSPGSQKLYEVLKKDAIKAEIEEKIKVLREKQKYEGLNEEEKDFLNNNIL
ncbi:MAG: hypothetical protein ACOCRX_10370 [Candidatus Woesearchaeota archaeon]